MVSRDRITQNGKYFGAGDVRDWRDFTRQVLEERRLLDIRAVGIPPVEISILSGDSVPHHIPLEDVAIPFGEHLRLEGLRDCIRNFLLAWPDLLQIDIIPVRILTDRFLDQIHIDPARNRVSHNQRR